MAVTEAYPFWETSMTFTGKAMKLFHRKSYKKESPWRDATLIFVVCEGRQREPHYFRFFHQLDSRLKLVIASAIENAKLNYSEEGYMPTLGSTKLHILGQRIYELTKSKLS